jgi:hypothetical protein
MTGACTIICPSDVPMAMAKTPKTPKKMERNPQKGPAHIDIFCFPPIKPFAFQTALPGKQGYKRQYAGLTNFTFVFISVVCS